MQWGPVDYHRQSLRNLQQASQQTRRMCAVILDIVGRELMIRRDFTLDHEVRRTHSTHYIVMPDLARKPCGLGTHASMSLAYSATKMYTPCRAAKRVCQPLWPQPGLDAQVQVVCFVVVQGHWRLCRPVWAQPGHMQGMQVHDSW